VFGSVAGGGAFGSTVGAMLAPTVGWRGLFVLVAAAGALALLNARSLWGHLAGLGKTEAQGMAGYVALLRTRRGLRTYAAIALNGAFHSGVFTWLGTRLHDQYGLGEAGIGLALLGYGIPGLLLGPAIGRVVDRYGRRRLIPAGLAVAAVAAAMLVPAWPLAVAVGASTVLSLGFDMTQPLFAGIATTLDDRRRGQAMGLNACVLFLGYGLGSLVFGALARHDMSHAFLTFALVQGTFALLAVALFRNE
jgi:predicted MFS family arabinose efflux permease